MNDEQRRQRQRAVHERLAQAPLRKLILGAGSRPQQGWIATDIEVLDMTRAEDWETVLGGRAADALLAEHVWEHLTTEQAQVAAALCFRHLRPGGRLRLAVPDGLHPNPRYIEHVRPGGTGPGADDHKILHDHRTLPLTLAQAGFAVELLEYWDENGRFHYCDWSSEDGHVARSRRFDERNRDGGLNYTSLIVDAIKPLPTAQQP